MNTILFYVQLIFNADMLESSELPPCQAKIHCGSEPARDEAGTFNLNVACPVAIASKPATTMLNTAGPD
jgi:hypothetical protein